MFHKLLSGLAGHRPKRQFITLKWSYYMSLKERLDKAANDLTAANKEIQRLQGLVQTHAATEAATADDLKPLLDASDALAAQVAVTAPPPATDTTQQQP